MFDKLFDVLVQFAGLFKPFTILTPNKKAVVCRWGKEVRQLETGFHWIWPFGVEEIFDLSMATRLAELASQALVTADGKQITAGIIITYRVHDISKALFSVWDAFSAAQDACQANFAQAVLATVYNELRTEAFADRLTVECRKQGFKYGFEIEKVRICELAPSRTIRLIGSGELSGHHA